MFLRPVTVLLAEVPSTGVTLLAVVLLDTLLPPTVPLPVLLLDPIPRLNVVF